MAIPVTPVVQPATDAVTYDTFWLSFLQVNAGDPNKPVRLMANVQKVKKNDDGTYTVPPRGLAGANGTLMIDDLFSYAQGDTQTITLPSTLGGSGSAVTLSIGDIVDALLLKVSQMAENQNNNG